MKTSLFFYALIFASSVTWAQTLFLPEKGQYIFSQKDIKLALNKSGANYVEMESNVLNPQLIYKLDQHRNEYQIKNWYSWDWFVLQEWFSLDAEKFMDLYDAETFNQAKQKQYAQFAFDKKQFFHYKTVPSMKEWGGLTHPPIKKLTMPLEKYHAGFSPLDYEASTSSYFSAPFQEELDTTSRSELSFGNKLIPLADQDAFRKKMDLIQKASHSILMSSLVFVCDQSTSELVELLIQKHLSGVEVKIITDGFLSKILRQRGCLKRMIKAGIEVLETKDFFKFEGKSIYHTKTLVVDKAEAVAGGQNMINADNLSRGTDFMNRDVDLYVKGPMVTDIVRQFVENWDYQTTLTKKHLPLKTYKIYVKNQLQLEELRGLRGKKYYEQILGNSATRMQGVCRFIKQAPYEDRHTIGRAYLKLLDQVSDHLVITDPTKSDTLVQKKSDTTLLESMDNFEMANLLFNKVQGLAKNGLKIDYITTNMNMAGNETVAQMNEKIRNDLEKGHTLKANIAFANIGLVNRFFGVAHYKNLLKDWVPHQSVSVWNHISFMHSKIFYFDRLVASVGSYNFYHNSTDHAYESTSVCMDKSLNQELEKILVQDMANSLPLVYSELK